MKRMQPPARELLYDHQSTMIVAENLVNVMRFRRAIADNYYHRMRSHRGALQ